MCCAIYSPLSAPHLDLSLSAELGMKAADSMTMADSDWMNGSLSLCYCSYDQIKGTQDKDFSHSFSDSLSATAPA